MKTKLYFTFLFVFAFSLAAASCKDTGGNNGDEDNNESLDYDDIDDDKVCMEQEMCEPYCSQEKAYNCVSTTSGSCPYYVNRMTEDCAPGTCVIDENAHIAVCVGGDMDDVEQKEECADQEICTPYCNYGKTFNCVNVDYNGCTYQINQPTEDCAPGSCKIEETLHKAVCVGGDMDEGDWDESGECPISEECVPYCDESNAVNCVGYTSGDCPYWRGEPQDCSPGTCKIDETLYKAVCVGGDLDDENESESSSVKLTDVSNSGCLNGYGKSDTQEESFSAVYYPDAKSVTATHFNAVYNCCIIKINVSMTIIGSVISLYETEVIEEPCKCDCPFNVYSSIEGLSPATYVVKFYQEGEYKGEASVTAQ